MKLILRVSEEDESTIDLLVDVGKPEQLLILGSIDKDLFIANTDPIIVNGLERDMPEVFVTMTMYD